MIPTMSSQSAGWHHGFRESWRRFAQQAQRNPIMRAFALERDERCAWCGLPIRKATYHLHHTDYQHECGFKGTTEAVSAKGRKRIVPDCGACKTQRPELFEGCASRLVAVHQGCNRDIALSPQSGALGRAERGEPHEP